MTETVFLVFSLAHVLPDVKQVGFMSYTEAHHQRVIEIFWLHIWELSIFIYSQ